MFVYEVPPIDDWSPWLSEDEYKAKLDAEWGPDSAGGWTGYVALRKRAFDLARAKLNWEGDFREGPFIAGLPPHFGESQSEVVIAWKQDNNGSCFIASPIEMPWLDDK